MSHASSRNDDKNDRGQALLRDAAYERQLARLAQSEDSFGTCLLLQLVDMYGAECIQWELGTLVLEILDRIGTLPSPATTFKLKAALAIAGSDEFYEEAAAFHEVAQWLGGREASDVPSPFEAAWASVEAHVVGPPVSEHGYSSEVKRYTAELLAAAGVVKLPQALSWCAEESKHVDAPLMFADDVDIGPAVFATQREQADQLDRDIADEFARFHKELTGMKLHHAQAKMAELRPQQLIGS